MKHKIENVFLRGGGGRGGVSKMGEIGRAGGGIGGYVDRYP